MHFSALLALVPLVAAAPSSIVRRAPVIKPEGARLIPSQYIVKLKETASTESLQDAMTHLGATEANHVYDSENFKGFASQLDAETLEKLQSHPEVDYIEQDAVVSINLYSTEASAPWGISRLSHKAKGNSTDYTYDDSAGAGTCAYVIDTGIYIAHTEFEGRATWLYNAVDKQNTDGNGHGTHVSGTIGSKTYGVAKKTSLFAVKVLNSDGEGSNSGVLAGMNFVTSDAPTRSCPNGTVANMSLGGSKSTTLNTAAANMIKAGVFLAVAAGNDNKDAAGTSPASETTVCTVGATTNADARATYSNYGAVVDIFAPGTNILSTWIGSSGTTTKTISGTSMATPHIVGLGAYLLSLLGKKDPQTLCKYIQSTAITGALTGIPSGTINALAFNGNPSG